MNALNSSAITIRYKQPFVDWNNALFPDMPMEVNILGEAKAYLINQISNDAEAPIKKHYKEIFETELEGICLDVEYWPAKRTFKLFNEWFNYEISDWVMDLSTQDLNS